MLQFAINVFFIVVAVFAIGVIIDSLIKLWDKFK